jgi:hypothetical protein
MTYGLLLPSASTEHFAQMSASLASYPGTFENLKPVKNVCLVLLGLSKPTALNFCPFKRYLPLTTKYTILA